MLITPNDYETPTELANHLHIFIGVSGRTIDSYGRTIDSDSDSEEKGGEEMDNKILALKPVEIPNFIKLVHFAHETLDYAIQNQLYEYFDIFVKKFIDGNIHLFMINEQVRHTLFERSSEKDLLTNISKFDIQQVLSVRPELLTNRKLCLNVRKNDLAYIFSLGAIVNDALINRCTCLASIQIIEKYLDFNTVRSKGYDNGTVLHILAQDDYDLDTYEYICSNYPKLVNVKDNNGNTALAAILHEGFTSNTPKIINIFAKHGVDPFIENAYGMTLFGMPVECVKLLLNAF